MELSKKTQENAKEQSRLRELRHEQVICPSSCTILGSPCSRRVPYASLRWHREVRRATRTSPPCFPPTIARRRVLAARRPGALAPSQRRWLAETEASQVVKHRGFDQAVRENVPAFRNDSNSRNETIRSIRGGHKSAPLNHWLPYDEGRAS